MRTQGVGVLSREDAISFGVSGPNLKAANDSSDLRKDEPYLVYDELDFEVPVEPDADSYSRMVTRIREVETSLDLILNQLLPNLPDGDYQIEKFPTRLPVGEAYGRIEGVRGIFGAYVRIDEDKAKTPSRVKIRSPSFAHMYAFKRIIESQETRLADVVVIFGSIDAYTAEFDR
jgi:NADH:ubiquinone oxidoreductase subunit D